MPGEIVTFTITISGTADAGTVLEVSDYYNPGLEVAGDPASAYVIVSSSNLTLGTPSYVPPPDVDGLKGFYLIGTVDVTGVYRASITVEMQVEGSVLPGTTIPFTIGLYDVLYPAAGFSTFAGGELMVAAPAAAHTTTPNTMPPVLADSASLEARTVRRSSQ